MKRRDWIAVMMCVAIMVLAACQAKSPTAPGSAGGSSGGATAGPASGVNHESSYDDDEVSARLTASPTTIQKGQYSTLTWTTDEAEDVYLNGVSVDESGSKNVYPTATTTYTLVAVDDDHRATSSVTVTVSDSSTSDDDDDDEISARLTASPTTIQAGQYSTLTWTTDEAEDVYLNGVSVDESGSKNVYPTATTTYTLVAVHDDHRATSSTTVTVSGTAPAPAPMPTATLTAVPASIQSGQQTTLTWVTTNATSVTMNGNPVALNGSQAYSPTSTRTYTLVATNAAGSTTATATVTVTTPTPPPPAPMPTASLTASPASIESGQQTTLTWVTTNATSVTMNDSPVALNGSQAYSPTATTTYRLVATNAAGSTTATATVTVTTPAPPPPPPPPPMPTASLTASPTSILSGEPTTLTWVTTDATSVTLNGTAVAVNGSLVDFPTATATYTLVASNAAGSRTATATVTVRIPPPPQPMPTASLTASPESIQSGQSSTLSWSTTDATTVTLNGAAVSVTGMQPVSPTATTIYTLVASNATGSITRSATVTVMAPAPAPALTYLKDIKPIMDSNCVMCHSGPQPTADYDVSTYTGVMKNVTPFDGSSRLIRMTQPGAPMHGYLNPDSAGRAEIIRRWIVDHGAPQQ